MDEQNELVDAESAESMRQFAAEVRERARKLPKSCLENQKPHVAAKALWMLAQGATPSDIQRVTGCGAETIRRLDSDHSGMLESRKEYFATRYAIAAQECTDVFFDKLKQLKDEPDTLRKTNIKDISISIGVVTDQALKMSGMPTTITETKRGMSMEDARKAIEDAKARARARLNENVIDAEEV